MSEVCTICNGDGTVMDTHNQLVTCGHCQGTGDEPEQDPNQAGGDGG